jgi:Mg2+ and Co2+ transporter CorA
MRVSFIGCEGTFEDYPEEDLPALVRRRDGFVWVDSPVCDDRTVGVLSTVFEFSHRDIKSCLERNRVPKVHSYPDYLFFIVHAPQPGNRGHVHFLELDQFVGKNFLVTVHAFNPTIKHPEQAQRETTAVYRLIKSGVTSPVSPWHISCDIVEEMTFHMEDYIEKCTRRVWQLQQRVTAVADGGDFSETVQAPDTGAPGQVERAEALIDSPYDSEPFLEDLFRTRHGLISVRTMAALGEETYKRLLALRDHELPERAPLVEVASRYKLLEALAQAQQEYLQGVIEHYRARIDTKRTTAAVSLAVIAVVTLPITALASVYGMNIIVNRDSDVRHLIVVLAVMLAMSTGLLLWARQRGWFRW